MGIGWWTIALVGILLGPEAAERPGEAGRNKAVARRLFEEVFGPRWRIDLVDRIHTPDFVAHGATRDVGLEENRRAVLAWKASTPDLVMRVERMVAEGDLVAVHWTGTGTNTGEGGGLPATGRKVTARGMTFFRFRDGRIAEEWSVVDMLGVMRQLGRVPEPAPR
jgi:steroid delta-isomerase-like uncharacterized protein